MQGMKDDKNKNMLMGSVLSNGERSKPSNNNNKHQDSLEFEVIEDDS